MPDKRELRLTNTQRETLDEMRRHHPKPYLRERAAALLKIEAGRSVNWVAAHGLLQKRRWETVAGWLNGYVENGVGSLYISEGRGRPAAYEP